MDPAFGPPSMGMGAALPNGALDGPVWLRFTPSTDGLGFDNSYTTVGALMPIWNSSGDGIWFTEGQGHISSQGRLFANLGVGGRIYEHGLRRTFGLSGWFDYDGDRYDNFGHDFYGLGVTFDSFGDRLDFHINAYVPIKDEYLLGGTSPGFVGNRIILVQGVDAGLRGTDFEAGYRLPFATVVDPRAYVGGYFYGSQTIDPFLGLSTRVEVQPTEYTTAQVRVTADEQFGVSTMFNFEVHLGGRKHRPAFDRITEPVHRNDHIVRYHRDPVYAINPITGLPYNVFHVNNDPLLTSSGQGTFESPFTTLAQAQLASGPADVVMVYGPTSQVRPTRSTGEFGGLYTGGIVLKDNQRLLGTGLTLVVRNGQLKALSPVISELDTRILNNDETIRQLIAGIAVGTANGAPGQTGDLHGIGTLADLVLTPRLVSQLQEFANNPVRGAENRALLAAAGIPLTPDIVLAEIPNAQPTIINPNGPGVTLANNNEVANFRIRRSQVGIFGNGIANFNIHDNRTRTDIAVAVAASVANTASSNRVAIQNQDPDDLLVNGVPDGGLDKNVGGGIVLENVRGAGRIVNNTVVENNRPNPPVTPNVPYADGVRVTVSGNDSLDLSIAGNEINRNDNGVKLISNTSGLFLTRFGDNFTNNNVNDGINISGIGTGDLVVSMLAGPRDAAGEPLLAPVNPETGIPIGPFLVYQDPLTGELRPPRSVFTPQTVGATPEERFASVLINPVSGTGVFTVASTQSNRNGDINKLPDTNGNGRGFFADVQNGRFFLKMDRGQFINNDSSFFPRYGAIQLNVEPAVSFASAQISRVLVMGTGSHDQFPRPGIDPAVVVGGNINDGFIDSGSGIRIVSNPGLDACHVFAIDDSEVSFNFSDGIKFLMLTEGLRTAAIPEGAVSLRVKNNLIASNVGITDDNGTPLGLNLFNTLDDYDSPGNLAPFPVGLLSNPSLKNEFNNNINGSGLVIRATGTDTAVFCLDILNNDIVYNEFDAINMAFAGRGNIQYVPSPVVGLPPVVPPVPLTPVRVFDPVVRDPITDTPIASVLSPDTFGVNAKVVIDNNRIGVGELPTTVTPPGGGTPPPAGSGVYEDAIKISLFDGSKVQMRISNNLLIAGDTRGAATTLGAANATTILGPGQIPVPPNLQPFEATTIVPLNVAGVPAVDPRYDSAIEVDTWDTSRLSLIIDNNDITAPRGGTGAGAAATGPFWNDGGITIQSHENSILVTRITRNRVNEVLDGNTDFSNLFPPATIPLAGAAINLLAEGNSTMVAFVNDNDLENRNLSGARVTSAYFEATSADNARLCLQLLDNNAQPGISFQLSHTLVLDGNNPTQPVGDAFYLVATELSRFEIEPTRATNHETILPESVSITTANLVYAGPGPLLPASDLVQFGNVASGNTEQCVRDLQVLGFPFDVGFPGMFNFDPPIIHP